MPAQPRFVADDVWLAGLSHLRDDLADRGFSLNRLTDESGLHRMQVTRMLSATGAGTVHGQRAIAEAMGRDPGFYFPRSRVELERAEALATLDERMETVVHLRRRAEAFDRAADLLEAMP